MPDYMFTEWMHPSDIWSIILADSVLLAITDQVSLHYIHVSKARGWGGWYRLIGCDRNTYHVGSHRICVLLYTWENFSALSTLSTSGSFSYSVNTRWNNKFYYKKRVCTLYTYFSGSKVLMVFMRKHTMTNTKHSKHWKQTLKRDQTRAIKQAINKASFSCLPKYRNYNKVLIVMHTTLCSCLRSSWTLY